MVNFRKPQEPVYSGFSFRMNRPGYPKKTGKPFFSKKSGGPLIRKYILKKIRNENNLHKEGFCNGKKNIQSYEFLPMVDGNGGAFGRGAHFCGLPDGR
jgi:hypothetical protein